MYHFIVNLKSGSGKGRLIWASLEQYLRHTHTPYLAHYTRDCGHARCISASLTAGSSPVTLIAVGGDGTANEVIDGIVRLDKVTFGYIPTGSSNDLARGLGLPKDPLLILQQILHPKRLLPIYLGRSCARNKARRFAVSCGIGYDAAVCHEALRSPLKTALNRIHLGKLTYLGIALKQLLMQRPISAAVETDDATVYRFPRLFFLAAMNFPFEGGGFQFCPQADPSDGLLDLCIVHTIPKWKILLMLPTAFFGKHVHIKGVQILRCSRVRILTASPLAVHTDGESLGFQNHLILESEREPLHFII